MRIVIIEDEIKIRNGMVRLLSGYEQHEVAGWARNGREGLELIRAVKPNLVFTDIRMPEMDGLEMLARLREEGIRVHAVILTGYAEFEYAREAVALGADDYLLKPIGVDEVERILEKIGRKVNEEQRMFAGTAEGWLKALLDGILENTPEEMNRAEAALGTGRVRQFLVGVYAGNTKKRNLPEQGFLGPGAGGLDVCACIRTDDQCWTIALLRYPRQQDSEPGALPEKLVSLLELRRKTFGSDEMVWLAEEVEETEQIHPVFRRMSEAALTASLQENRRVFRVRDLEGDGTAVFHLSSRMESEYINALTGTDKEEPLRWIDALFSGMKGRLWTASGIRICADRICSVTEEQVMRLWPEKRRQLQTLDTAARLRRAVTAAEIRELLLSMIRTVRTDSAAGKDNIRNFTILRAIAYIRENYARKISLEEIASELSITPEYLSMLFAREIGVNYSSFLNEFRISRARNMLRETDMKIYEVAEQSGFSDTKYFSKVFRDTVGMTPREYRESVH